MNLAVRPYFLGILLLAFVVYGIERLIVTDKEAIEALGDAVAEAIQKEDYARLEGLLDPGFEYAGRDRATTIGYVRGLVRQYRPIGVQVHLFDIHVEGDHATAAGVVSASVMGRPQEMRVDATLVRSADGWVLEGAKPALVMQR
jgi:Domain of unknown function (DUF4440)